MTDASTYAKPASPNAVPLALAVGLWLLLAAGRAASSASDSGAAAAGGAFVGVLLTTIFLAFVGRSIYRLIRRRPVFARTLTPGLFWGAAGITALVTLSSAGAQSG